MSDAPAERRLATTRLATGQKALALSKAIEYGKRSSSSTRTSTSWFSHSRVLPARRPTDAFAPDQRGHATRYHAVTSADDYAADVDASGGGGR